MVRTNIFLAAHPRHRDGPQSTLLRLYHEYFAFLHDANVCVMGGAYHELSRFVDSIELNDQIQCLPHGASGGVRRFIQRIQAELLEGNDCLVIYLMDPGDPSWDYAETRLLKAKCAEFGVPFATNLASAREFLRLLCLNTKPSNLRAVGAVEQIRALITTGNNNPEPAPEELEFDDFAGNPHVLRSIEESSIALFATEAITPFPDGTPYFRLMGTFGNVFATEPVVRSVRQSGAPTATLLDDAHLTQIDGPLRALEIAEHMSDGNCQYVAVLNSQSDTEVDLLERASQSGGGLGTTFLRSRASVEAWLALKDAASQRGDVDLFPTPAALFEATGCRVVLSRGGSWSAVADTAARFIAASVLDRIAHAGRLDGGPVAVGVSWGRGLHEVLLRVRAFIDESRWTARLAELDADHRLATSVAFVPMIGHMGADSFQFESSALAMLLADTFGGTSTPLAVNGYDRISAEGTAGTHRDSGPSSRRLLAETARSWRQLDMCVGTVGPLKTVGRGPGSRFPNELLSEIRAASIGQAQSIFFSEAALEPSFGEYQREGVSVQNLQQVVRRRGESILVCSACDTDDREDARRRVAIAAISIRRGIVNRLVTTMDFMERVYTLLEERAGFEHA